MSNQESKSKPADSEEGEGNGLSVPSRILRLTLKEKKRFDQIAAGIKKEEYREIEKRIISRLHDKSYELVEFSYGCGDHVSKVTVEYLGWGTGLGRSDWGATPRKPTIIIRLGKVLSRRNE